MVRVFAEAIGAPDRAAAAENLLYAGGGVWPAWGVVGGAALALLLEVH